MKESIVYPGRELEAMSLAVNYHRWIFQSMRPYLGKRLLEVGAGTGSFSEIILEYPAEALTLLEPSALMYEQLKERLAHSKSSVRVETYNATFREVAGRLKASHRPDTILYINVLEHITDDEAELALVRNTLDRHGRVCIFVPALKWLYGRFDEQVGHARRYTRPELEDKIERAGFKIIKSSYFDFIGVIPWYIKYRILKSDKMESWAVKLYDQYMVGITKAIESAVRPPLGKNIVLIAEKI